jgi:transcriptional regulator of acetoin/glycerol metabolism
MPLAMQAALLRVLDTGTFRRVGEQVLSMTDARIVCATCRDLNALVAAGGFRQDLFYRLRGVIIRLPPLRERSDVVALAHHLIGLRARALQIHAPELAPEAEALLASYSWPGNVRELNSALEVALVASRGERVLSVRHLPQDMLLDEGRTLARGLLEEHQLNTARRVLSEARGNISLAAKKLGVARSTLYRMLRRHGSSGE